MLPFLEEFYGSVTTNEKGQIVIPADARKAMGICAGDKLLVLSGPGKHGLVIVKPEILVGLANRLEGDKKRLDKMINKDTK
jgi:AbrB family looped-hinge helix DNA binding protein